MSDEEADVVVIGPGMGGLAAAHTIAQFGGKQVLVLEQHYTLGGMTHEFSRAGRYRFGTGLHYMSASAGPFLGFMTDERAQLSLLPDECDVLHFPGFDFAVPATKERLRARLKERFPAEADAIDGFFRTTRWAMAGLTARNVFASFPAGLRTAGAPVIAEQGDPPGEGARHRRRRRGCRCHRVHDRHGRRCPGVRLQSRAVGP